jgi:hypothetical protein
MSRIQIDFNSVLQFDSGEPMEARLFGEIVPQKKKFNVDNKVTFGDLVDQDFVVLDYELFSPKFEDCNEFAVILIRLNDKQAVTTTSSRVIIDQLGRIKNQLPVKVQLNRRNKYFTFS